MANMDVNGKRGGSGGGEFAKQANSWPTPDAGMSERGGVQTENMTGQSLTQTVNTLWTTPQAHDSGGGSPERVRRKGTEHGCANLADDVTKWAIDE
jgi:hypothetical protein